MRALLFTCVVSVLFPERKELFSGGGSLTSTNLFPPAPFISSAKLSFCETRAANELKLETVRVCEAEVDVTLDKDPLNVATEPERRTNIKVRLSPVIGLLIESSKSLSANEDEH